MAARQLSATVNDKDSTTDEAAKALYLRGIAYRKLGQPARAISDLGAAVWLGLGSSEKVRALVNKGLAYRAVGLSRQADGALSQARSASSAGEVDRLIAKDGSTAVASAGSVEDVSTSGSVWDRLVPSFGSSSSDDAPTPSPEPEAAPTQQSTQTAAAPSSGWSAEVSEESAESGGNSVSRWFGSLTGDSAPAPSATNPIPAPTTTTASRGTTTAERTPTAPRTAAAPPSAASWAANTETQKIASEGDGTAVGRWFSRQTSSEPGASPAASAAQGPGYTVQLANSRSKAEAEALWKKARGSNSQLASASSRIEKVDIGSFGTFYSVKIGPFASQAESSKVCNALKRGGTDCSVVSPDGP
ncbi:MAG TPA: SPOR domain-containing protein [Methyloceanibacter sp.]|nr:SPOR domain-containing protein [Methyloceanibacter sp.]